VCLYTVRPGPVDDINVHTNDTDVYVSFNSPKLGESLQYNVSADCAEDGSQEVNCLEHVIRTCYNFLKPLVRLIYSS